VTRLHAAKVNEPPAAPDEHTIADWLQLIRAEYHEIPGLHLTKPQVQQLWNLDATTCDTVLEALEAIRFLRRTHTGAYVKADT
jgi:hypothetical protein